MLSLCPLPYSHNALEPHISARTLDFHHNKHHQGYIDKTNDLAAKAGLADAPLEEIVAVSRSKPEPMLFNNAAQAWNHAFYWQSMVPDSVMPSRKLLSAINAAFGDFESFREAFIAAGTGHFGSGWLWLAVNEAGTIELRQTHDGETLADAADGVPLLVCDLWEHAYYLEWQNDRHAYLKVWFEQLANWQFAAEQLAASSAGTRGFNYAEAMTEPA